MKKVARFLTVIVFLSIAITTARADEPVYFADPNLKLAVEEELGISDPNATDMLALTSLVAINRGIVDLTGLEYATNLMTLYLTENQISNISPLAGLTNLTGLSLGYNQISDISALAGLTELTRLDLQENQLNTAAYCVYLPMILANNWGIDLDYDPNPNPLTNDCSIDLPELAVFVAHWLEADCGLGNNWCGWADFDHVNDVDIGDFGELARYWLAVKE